MITILTPTYNRAYILPKLYNSLKEQSSNFFEWIIVDDGSTDDTEKLVQKWLIETNEFKIKYIKKENGGKHKAINEGVLFAKYEYVYIIDSDDYILPKAIDQIHKWLNSISIDKKFAGVSGLRGQKRNEKLEILGQFPEEMEYVDATNLERKKFHLLGDKAEIYRTELLQKYKFPEFENEKFLSEGVVWDKIAADGYKIRWFGEIICVCEYLEDGLTKNNGVMNKVNNFKGYTCFERQNIKLQKFPYNYLAIGRFSSIAKEKGRGVDVKGSLEIGEMKLFLGVLLEKLRVIIKK